MPDAWRWGSGCRPIATLAWRLGVTVGTVSRAYAEAERRGLVVGEVGRGSFVRAGARSAAMLAMPDVGGPQTIELGINRPPIGIAETALAEAMVELGRSPRLGDLVNYQAHTGRWEHRMAGARLIGRRGHAVDPGNRAGHQRCGARHRGHAHRAVRSRRHGDGGAVHVVGNPRAGQPAAPGAEARGDGRGGHAAGRVRGRLQDHRLPRPLYHARDPEPDGGGAGRGPSARDRRDRPTPRRHDHRRRRLRPAAGASADFRSPPWHRSARSTSTAPRRRWRRRCESASSRCLRTGSVGSPLRRGRPTGWRPR